MGSNMIRICAYCGKDFSTYDKRIKYCSEDCSRRFRLDAQKKRSSVNRNRHKQSWAQHEAQRLYEISHDCGVDCLTDYVYNNYKKKGK